MRFTQTQVHSSTTDYAHWPRRPVRPTKLHVRIIRALVEGEGGGFGMTVFNGNYLASAAGGNR